MDCVFRTEDEFKFREGWQEYLANHPGSYRYTLSCLEYLKAYIQELAADESFVLLENKKPVGICFLPVEKSNGRFGISSCGGFTAAPLAAQERAEKEAYAIVEMVAKKHKVSSIRFFLDPLVQIYQEKFNTLLKYGYTDASSTDCLVDLRRPENDIWSGMRKNHRRNIKKVRTDPDYTIVVMDYANPQYPLHEQYRQLHHRCSGRVTRSQKTFDIQYSMLKDDHAAMFGLLRRGQMIGCNYFFHHKTTAVYASGSDDPDIRNVPLYHALIWSAVEYYKKRAFEYMQIARPCGFNRVSGFGDYLDDKQLNISHFKRGFGGRMVPFFRGVKYFDRDLFLQEEEAFKQKMLEVIPC